MCILLVALCIVQQRTVPADLGKVSVLNFDAAAFRGLTRRALGGGSTFVGNDGRTVGVTTGKYSQLHELPAFTTVNDVFRFKGNLAYSVSQERYLAKSTTPVESAMPVGIGEGGLVLVASFPGASIWEPATFNFRVGLIDLSQRGTTPNRALSLRLKSKASWVRPAIEKNGQQFVPVILEDGTYGQIEFSFRTNRIKFLKSAKGKWDSGVLWKGRRFQWSWKGEDKFVGTKDGVATDWVVAAVSMNGRYAWAVHLPSLYSAIVSR